uniref:Uncharacterized protein n=1 Tax=Anguilla anguilla TaxID=7936 RepID=A0A0E9XA71_ANGAN
MSLTYNLPAVIAEINYYLYILAIVENKICLH